jgi:Fe2+ or Zn2+ uptake regulation protein
MTKQRKLIFDIVNSSCVHPTAEQVYFLAKEQMPTIVMATVYNNLNTLTSEGLIRRISIHGDPDRYDGIKKEHEHLKCDICGAVTDTFMGGILNDLNNRTGVELTSYELNMHYVCDKCRTNDIN